MAAQSDAPTQDQNEDLPPPPPFALKALVYGMGVLLMFGLIAFAGALWWKSKQEAPEPQASAISMPGAVSFAKFDERVLPLPAGTRILETDLDGATLMLRLEAVEGGRPSAARTEYIWLYDLSSQSVIGTYRVPVGGTFPE